MIVVSLIETFKNLLTFIMFCEEKILCYFEHIVLHIYNMVFLGALGKLDILCAAGKYLIIFILSFQESCCRIYKCLLSKI